MGAPKNFWSKSNYVGSGAFQERKFAIADSTFWADHDDDFTQSCELRSYNFR
jgi:hypothetical protein